MKCVCVQSDYLSLQLNLCLLRTRARVKFLVELHLQLRLPLIVLLCLNHVQFAHAKVEIFTCKNFFTCTSRIMLIRLSEIFQSYVLMHVAILTNVSLTKMVE